MKNNITRRANTFGKLAGFALDHFRHFTLSRAMFGKLPILLLLAALVPGVRANVIQANQTYPPPNGSFRSPGLAYNFGSGASAVQLKDIAFTFFDNFTLVAGPVASLSFNAQFSH